VVEASQQAYGSLKNQEDEEQAKCGIPWSKSAFGCGHGRVLYLMERACLKRKFSANTPPSTAIIVTKIATSTIIPRHDAVDPVFMVNS
jgi:hypothetical protein